MVLLFSSITIVLITLVLALSVVSIYFMVSFLPLAPKKLNISLELDIDRTPFEVGSTLTVFGVTFTVVEGEQTAPNQVQAVKGFNEQWEEFFSALVAAEIEPGKLFVDYYSIAYGFYITITDTSDRGVAPDVSGFFDGAVSIYTP